MRSWSCARALLVRAMQAKEFILCAREFQNSIADSVYRVLENQINMLGLNAFFRLLDNSIICTLTGTEFTFRGLHRNIQSIKSLEGVTICFVEEAQTMSQASWLILLPTIRAPGSEIWVAYNPVNESDPTSQMFQVNPDPRAIVVQTTYQDNPWWSEEMEGDRLKLLATDPELHAHVYGGEYLTISEAAIFRNRYVVQDFVEPEQVDRIFFGMDFGFSTDPAAIIRGYILDNVFYITHAEYGYKVEIDDLPAFMDGGLAEKNGTVYSGFPGIRQWPIKADSSRPETISYLMRKGYNIAGAEKWQGSVEDGIAHLKGFHKIVIHTRCTCLIAEARNYSYKVDPKTGDVLPVIVDKHNHAWDAARYSLDGYIQRRGGLGVWGLLANRKK